MILSVQDVIVVTGDVIIYVENFTLEPSNFPEGKNIIKRLIFFQENIP